ncbi:MAG: prevent-host-death protein [Candidatus Competibacteraceae bacterium]
MKMMTIGELKMHFSEVLEQVKHGETVVVCYGKQKHKVAAIIPYEQLTPASERPLGLLQEKASFILYDDFAISDDELLGA